MNANLAALLAELPELHASGTVWILAPSPLAARLCHAAFMKNKNKRELEKRWATEAAKKRKATKKKTTRREDVDQAAARIVREATPD